jgi:hypothetical protein
MPFGKTQGWKALQNDTSNCVIFIEPPDADPHVRWCERGWLAAAPYSIPTSPLKRHKKNVTGFDGVEFFKTP